jgi:hypothetical protein
VLSAILHNAASIFCCMFSMLRWLLRNYAKNCSAVYGGGGGGGGSWFSLPAALPLALVASYTVRRVFDICIFQQQ